MKKSDEVFVRIAEAMDGSEALNVLDLWEKEIREDERKKCVELIRRVERRMDTRANLETVYLEEACKAIENQTQETP